MSRIDAVRQKLLEQGFDGILLSNKINRIYVSGFTGTDAYIFITQAEAYLITDNRYFEQIKEQAPLYTLVEKKVQGMSIVWRTIEASGAKRIAYEADDLKVASYLALVTENKPEIIELVPTTNFIEVLRMVKSSTELQQLTIAAEIADSAYTYILEHIHVGMSEQEVAFLLDQFVRKNGANDIAFETIIASGLRSAMPHGHASRKIIQNNDIVTIDFGAVYNGYYSDMTRTFGMGKVSEELRKIYEIVYTAQVAGVQVARPGMSASALDGVCRDIIDLSGYGAYFGHGTGHGIGLTCHEYPLLNQDATTILRDQMCITIEPGIYVPNIGGVRIEDTVLLTDTGAVCLTKSSKEWCEV